MRLSFVSIHFSEADRQLTDRDRGANRERERLRDGEGRKERKKEGSCSLHAAGKKEKDSNSKGKRERDTQNKNDSNAAIRMNLFSCIDASISFVLRLCMRLRERPHISFRAKGKKMGNQIKWNSYEEENACNVRNENVCQTTPKYPNKEFRNENNLLLFHLIATRCLLRLFSV